ncbi:hypothetical protein CF15_08360 [Pyrodictium occultum]|uniref:Uncharacterized protein n=1 Tax=Pyrodictium occultum TaxID=2309 RepID=A0A0V8RRY1_PYROC|nr:hypothetical protein CF15_08360 [Pyrodictium occultum]
MALCSAPPGHVVPVVYQAPVCEDAVYTHEHACDAEAVIAREYKQAALAASFTDKPVYHRCDPVDSMHLPALDYVRDPVHEPVELAEHYDEEAVVLLLEQVIVDV